MGNLLAIFLQIWFNVVVKKIPTRKEAKHCQTCTTKCKPIPKQYDKCGICKADLTHLKAKDVDWLDQKSKDHHRYLGEETAGLQSQ